MLTEKEKLVLEALRETPFSSQKELAERLHLNRSTLASVIQSLTQKNKILGRAYVLNDDASNIFCIGGMNVDRKFHTYDKLIPGTSNPAYNRTSVGGVVRNVAENLGRLGYKPHLLSLGGDDFEMDYIQEHSEDWMDLHWVQRLTGRSTGSYSAIIDVDGEMACALAVMDINEAMDVAWIQGFENQLKTARLIVLDLNLPRDTVAWLIHFAKTHAIPLAVIPVSAPKMARLPKDLDGVTWLIVNQDESEAFFGVRIQNDDDFNRLPDLWIKAGCEQVVVTRGIRPARYGHRDGTGQSFLPPTVDRVIDVTGAGDAYAAGILFGALEGMMPDDAIRLGMTNAWATIQTEDTVRRDLTAEVLKQEVQKLTKEGKLS